MTVINKIGIAIVGALLLVGCSSSSRSKTDAAGALVTVNGESLFEDDLRNAMPIGLHGEDSVRFADAYIRNWVEDAVLFMQAEDNIPSDVKIDELVASYRRSLIMHVYQEELVRQKLDENLSEEDMRAYYDAHKDLFPATRPYVKGLFLKVPSGSPQLNKVRAWYRNPEKENLDRLEKYSLSNAVQFDYFADRWKPVSELSAKIPLAALSSSEGYLRTNRNVEVRDTAYCYFLHIDDFVGTGEQLPFDVVENEIKEMLINIKRVDFIRQTKKDLYERALKNKEIIYRKE